MNLKNRRGRNGGQIVSLIIILPNAFFCHCGDLLCQIWTVVANHTVKKIYLPKLSRYESAKALNLGIIGAGVAIAALGAADGSTIGMMIQLLGIIVEAARLAMMQLTLQARGLKLSPITALYYIAPAVIPVLLTVAIFKGEIYQLYQDGWKFPLWMMLTNMMLAFSLNFIGILVIKVRYYDKLPPKCNNSPPCCDYPSVRVMVHFLCPCLSNIHYFNRANTPPFLILTRMCQNDV